MSYRVMSDGWWVMKTDDEWSFFFTQIAPNTLKVDLQQSRC